MDLHLANAEKLHELRERGLVPYSRFGTKSIMTLACIVYLLMRSDGLLGLVRDSLAAETINFHLFNRFAQWMIGLCAVIFVAGLASKLLQSLFLFKLSLLKRRVNEPLPRLQTMAKAAINLVAGLLIGFLTFTVFAPSFLSLLLEREDLGPHAAETLRTVALAWTIGLLVATVLSILIEQLLFRVQHAQTSTERH